MRFFKKIFPDEKPYILDAMEELVENFYSFTYTGIVAGEDEDTDDNVDFRR